MANDRVTPPACDSCRFTMSHVYTFRVVDLKEYHEYTTARGTFTVPFELHGFLCEMNVGTRRKSNTCGRTQTVMVLPR